MAMVKDTRYHQLRKAVLEGLPAFPLDLRKAGPTDQEGEQRPELKVSISECDVDDRGLLRFRNRIWVPEDEPLRTGIVQQTHDSYLTGHPGREGTIDLVSRRFFWPGISSYIRRFARNCDVCGAGHQWRHRKKGLLKPLPVPERIWHEISIDFMTDLPSSGPEGATNCMVITDRLSKSVILEPMESLTTEAVAVRFLDCCVRHHGIPRAITSDRGTQWVNHFWKRVCELLHIVRRLSTAYHPQTDGATERMNQEIQAYIRAFTVYSQDDWSQLLPACMIAINNRRSSSTGQSPFSLTHGYDIEILQLEEPEPSATTNNKGTQQGQAFVDRLKEATEWAQAAIAATQQRQEQSANQHRDPAENFRVGDKVWLDLKNIRTQRPSRKFDWLHVKYTIIEVMSSHSYKLDVPLGIHPVFHVDLLKRANNDPLPSQIRHDPQPPGMLVNDHYEWEIEEILQAETRRVGRGTQRWALVKWVGYARPTWEPVANLEETIALIEFEEKYGSIQTNNGAKHTPPKTKRDKEGGVVTGCTRREAQTPSVPTITTGSPLTPQVVNLTDLPTQAGPIPVSIQPPTYEQTRYNLRNR